MRLRICVKGTNTTANGLPCTAIYDIIVQISVATEPKLYAVDVTPCEIPPNTILHREFRTMYSRTIK